MTTLPTAPLALVVDDDPEILELVAEVLDGLGLRALTTFEPDTVPELAALHQPAVILLDIMMRGMDGYTLATRLRGDLRTASIPIVFMTGEAAPIYRTLSFGVGAVAHVEKPFTPATLQAAIGRALSAG
jgi:CheY-like chemotaxis protein